MSRKLMLRELCRSLRENGFVNILLIVQFVISFFLITTMITFYIDIGNNKNADTITKLNNREWYSARIDLNEDWIRPQRLALESDAVPRLNRLYQSMADSEKATLLSFYIQPSYFLKRDMDRAFKTKSYDDMLEYEDSKESAIFEEMDLPSRKGEIYTQLKTVEMNLGAYDEFRLETEEGEGFTKENMTLNNDRDVMPVLLGNNYKGTFQIGDVVEIQYIGFQNANPLCDVRITGFLKKGEKLPIYGGEDEFVELDNYVVLPMGMNITYLPESVDKRTVYANTQYISAIEYSFVSMNKGYDYSDYVLEANRLSTELDLFKLYFSATSFGLEMLENETRESTQSLLLLTIAMVCFMLFCIISSCINRFRKNARVYAIYLLNGSELANIILAYLVEMTVLMVPGMVLNYLLIARVNRWTGNMAPFLLVVGMAILVVFLVAAVIHTKLRTLNIEEYMRRE
ncbi:MAG: hypothetical protein K6G65_06650 [Lachnospiraceae bacterium]|nr:hypothetical protein [Lachnospiraceae bacterium]